MRPDLSGIDPLELNLATRFCVGDLLTRTALLAHCRQHLAGFQVPKRIVVRSDLPKTATGKIQKAELREEFRG